MKRSVIILFLMLACTFFAQAQNKRSGVTLFPVPVTGNVINVGLKTTTASKASSVELRNFIGKMLQSVPSNTGEIKFTDISQYPEGVYVVLVKDKKGKIVDTAKFMISK